MSCRACGLPYRKSSAICLSCYFSQLARKELADTSGLSKERAKRLLAKAQTVDVNPATGSLTLGAEFHRCLVDLLEQPKLQEVRARSIIPNDSGALLRHRHTQSHQCWSPQRACTLWDLACLCHASWEFWEVRSLRKTSSRSGGSAPAALTRPAHSHEHRTQWKTFS